MKEESLVIVNQNVTVNDLSNFAHTAHHTRKVVLAGNLTDTKKILFKTIIFFLKNFLVFVG